MKKVNLSWLLPMLLVFGGVIIFFGTFTKAESATAGHVVISEIQVASLSSGNDEFIELYNPTSSIVDLSGFQLTKKPQDALPESNLIASLSGQIASHGFLLIAKSNSNASASANLVYSSSISDNNTITLYKDSTRVEKVDEVGFGIASDSETAPAATPSAGKSIERKANVFSDVTSMGIGGSDEFAGNSEDTDNNSNDFVVRDNPQPQNSSSPIEPTPVPTLTEAPTVTPTVIPTEVPTPTTEPTTLPTQEPTPSPTIEPTASPAPTLEPTSTPIPTMTHSPTLSPTPTTTIAPSPTGIPSASRFTVVCSTKIISISIGFIHLQIPFPTCKLIKI